MSAGFDDRAFPFDVTLLPDELGVSHRHISFGMSLRDYFAAQALIGLIINPASVSTVVPITELAYELADRMLERRKE